MTVLKEAGEMIQPLKALAAPTDDLSPFPAPTWSFTTTCDFTVRESSALLWLPQALALHTMYKHTYR